MHNTKDLQNMVWKTIVYKKELQIQFPVIIYLVVYQRALSKAMLHKQMER